MNRSRPRPAGSPTADRPAHDAAGRPVPAVQPVLANPPQKRPWFLFFSLLLLAAWIAFLAYLAVATS